ncbi:hypothetical protein [Martelella sp. AD-3]|uniref:hypothetical protein n=1 Tax=Martelella sp. AD-3 TaxID=686597 RepID=UPI00046558C0|nr:hypothetical protein [Martelella sp. AD-3]AMM84130.1 hypothetical protein AZF01_06975 [Martelella sp. AD-3]
MTLEEQKQVIQALVVTAEVMGGEMTPIAARVFARDLSVYPFASVMRALERCRREHAGRLVLKVILDMVDPGRGWPSASEAWAAALPALDERETVVWSKETRAAWNVARPVMLTGDKVGARMAFIAAYDRLVGNAKLNGCTLSYEVSYGWDETGREAAIERAREHGLLGNGRAESGDARSLTDCNDVEIETSLEVDESGVASLSSASIDRKNK